jgi:hypothetical protein
MLDIDDEISSAVQAILDARPTFRVGDQVRIRLEGECRVTAGSTHGHDGEAGTVALLYAELHGEEIYDGHGVFVAFRGDAEGRTEGGWFALTELEPLP